MRGFTMVAAVVLTVVAAATVGPLWLQAQHEEGAARGRFRDLFRVGNHVLVRSSSEIMHLTPVGDEELPRVRPTPEERKEYEALRAERSAFEGFRDDPGDSREERDRQMQERAQRLQERNELLRELRTKMALRRIVLAGEDYIGLRDVDGRTTYVPHHRIGSVAGSRK